MMPYCLMCSCRTLKARQDKQRRAGRCSNDARDGAAHAHYAATAHDTATTRARRDTMCMLLLRVVLLAVAIDTCTYLLCGVYVYIIYKG